MSAYSLILAVAVVAFLSSPPSLAQRATDTDMAEDALDPIVGSRIDAGVKSARIQQLRSAALERARTAPNALTSATVVFNKGLTVKSLAMLAENFRLHVIGMNVKAPLNDDGMVQFLLIGIDDLLRPKGSFETRAEYAIGHYRYNFLEWAESLPPDEAEDSINMALSPMRIYGCEVFGPARSLFDLSAHSDVVVVAIDSPGRSGENVTAYTQLKVEYEDAWRRLEQRASETQ